MLRRFRGIKPTHLWHYTSQKDILYVLKRRLTARENLEQRERKDLLQLVSIVLASSVAILYSYGKISPEKTFTTIIPEPCKPKNNQEKPTATKQKCPKIDKTQPCPPENDKNKPKPCP